MHSHFRETHTKILHFWKKPPPNPKVPSTLEEDQNFSMIETNMYYYVDTHFDSMLFEWNTQRLEIMIN